MYFSVNCLRFALSIISFAFGGSGGGPGDGDGVPVGGSAAGGVDDGPGDGDGVGPPLCGYGMLMAANNTKTLIIKIVAIERSFIFIFFFRKDFFFNLFSMENVEDLYTLLMSMK